MKIHKVQKNQIAMVLGDFIKEKYSIGYMKSVFRKKAVRVNNIKVSKDYILQEGDQIEFFLKFQSSKTIKLDILFENEDFFVINKAPKIAVHGGKNISSEDSLVKLLKQEKKNFFFVHRLDFNTSGCLIVGKNEESKKIFLEMFKKSGIEKEYTALVLGLLDNGVIEKKLEGRNGQKVDATTYYTKISQYESANVTLIFAKIKQGRFHQIRKHFSFINHPILGDKKYGNFKINKEFERSFKLKRQFLHASSLSFLWKGKKILIKSSLSADLENVISQLEKR